MDGLPFGGGLVFQHRIRHVDVADRVLRQAIGREGLDCVSRTTATEIPGFWADSGSSFPKAETAPDIQIQPPSREIWFFPHAGGRWACTFSKLGFLLSFNGLFWVVRPF